LAPIMANLSGQEFVRLEQEAQKLGLTLSQDNVDQLRQLALANKDTAEAMEGLNIQVGLLVAPYLTDLAKWVAQIAKDMNAGGRDAVSGFAGQIKLAAQDVQGLSSDLQNLIKVYGEWKASFGNAPGATAPLPGGEKGPAPGDIVAGIPAGPFQFQIDFSQGLPGALRTVQEALTSHQGDLLRAFLGQAGAVVPASFFDQLNVEGKKEVAQQEENARAVSDAYKAAQAAANVPPTPPIDTGEYHQHVMNAQAANDVVDAKQREADLTQLSKVGGLEQQVIQQQINVAKRESIELSTRITQADLQNIPIHERQLALQQQLLVASDQTRVIEEQAAVARAQMAAAPAQQALEDAQFRQRELQAQIAASVAGGLGVPAGAIQELIANARARPALDLAALEAGRGVTLAEREQTAAQRQTELATAPIREEQAQLAIVEGQQQQKIQMLHDEQQAQKDKAEIAVAGLQGELQALEDINFQLKLRQELNQLNAAAARGGVAGEAGGAPQVNVQMGDFTINSQMDLDDVKSQLEQAILDGFNQAMKQSPNTAGQGQPGGRNQVATAAG